MTQEYGAATQLEKINMLDLADAVVLNKFDRKGSLDALRDIRKQMVRNLGAWDKSPEDMPVFPTTASQFNDEGVNRLFAFIIQKMNEKLGRSEEHTSELQSRGHLVCRLLLEKKNNT